MKSNKSERHDILKDYLNPIPLGKGKTSVFKVENYAHVPYIERIVPLSEKPLYDRLAQLDIAIPHIVHIIEDQDQLIVIEEYIEAPHLDDYCQHHQLSSDEVHRIMIQLLDILEVLHAQNPPIIHRDIKPENIFYDGQKIILADFDIARLAKKENRDTQVLGTIGYAAPEQFGFAASTPATDLYACGILLNYLYLQKMPSVALYKGPEKKIIIKATSISPSERYKTAQEMIDDLNHVHHCFYALPGFRHRKISHMLLAMIGYAFIIYFSIYVGRGESLIDHVCMTLACFLILFGGVLLFSDYRHLQKYCLFHRSSYPIIKVVGIIITYLAYSLIIFIALAVLSGILPLL